MATEADIWKQREETVFQINDQYRRFWYRGDYSLGRKKGNEEEIAYFVPIMFDKANRTFNWVAAANPILEAATSGYENSSSTKYAQDALPTVLKTLCSVFFENGDEKKKLQWQKFEDRYSDQPGAFKEYIEFIHEAVEKYGRQSEYPNGSDSLLLSGTFERLWTAILMAYSCYSHPSDQNFEGIFFRILEDVGHTHPETIADPVFGVANNGKFDLTDWKNARGSSFPECPIQDGDGRRTMSKPDKGGLRYSDSRIEEAKVLQSAFLSPLLMDWDGEGKTLKDVTETHNFILLVPIYDVWSGTQGWGGLKAVLVIALKPPELGFEDNAVLGKEKIGNPAWQHNYEKMLERCGEFAQEIGHAATRRALSRPIVPLYDLVRQFLRILIEVQDWEEAVVFYDGNPNYLFKRVSHDNTDKKYKGVRKRWEEEEWKGSGAYQQSPKPSNWLTEERNEFYMWWTSQNEQGCQDLWSQAVLPGLSDEEREEVGGISIRFKFPKACRIPPDLDTPDLDTRKFLVEAYRRQQLDLMRGLIPKVRARRAALRNAVSAIMGRNMSHNIGSHVLARYAAEIGKAAPNSEGDKNKIDPAADFLSYLQRRMDFLAEVGTSDKAFWTQPLLLGVQLDRLNLKHERERLRDESTPLLTYITGKADLPANVEFDEFSPSTLFSCPGGEVGVHALYVVLENVIRNSARHNPERRHEVHIRVCTVSHKEFPDLIKLRITDTGSVIKVVEEGKKILPQQINDIMDREILDPDGRPHPEYWGIREMQICAQYLRQLQLSDLEDVPYADDDMTAKAPLIKAEGEVGESLSYVIYLREAKPLAKIERGEETNIGGMKDGVAQVTLSRALLAREGTPKSKDELLKEQAVLKGIRNYIFAAYNGDDADLAKWAERHADSLSLRCLTQIPPHVHGKKNPKLLLEILCEALAKQIQKAQDSEGGGDKTLPLADPAGLAFARDTKLKVRADKFVRGNNNKPLTIKHAPNMGDDDAQFLAFLDNNRGYIGVEHHRLNACIWLDHPWPAEVKKYSILKKKFVSISVEPIFSHSPATEAICALEPGEGWELIAAALPRVVVLDERVQAAADNEVRDALKVKDCWPGMHVEVPTTEQMKLDGPTFSSCRDYLKGLQKSVDYVILHLTVLEKLNDERRKMKADELHLETLEALVHDTPAESAAIMLATGRGVSTFARSGTDLALAKRVRYLPVSAFLEYLARTPSKLGLMRVLWSASSPWRESDGESDSDISQP